MFFLQKLNDGFTVQKAHCAAWENQDVSHKMKIWIVGILFLLGAVMVPMDVADAVQLWAF